MRSVHDLALAPGTPTCAVFKASAVHLIARDARLDGPPGRGI
jgi:molybdopterin-binding protein